MVGKSMKAVITLLAVSSFSFLLTYIGNFKGNLLSVIVAYATGILFWGGLISAYIIFAVINSKRKKTVKKKTAFKEIGLVNFFSNQYAKCFDILLVVFLLLITISLFVQILENATVIFITGFVFSLHMHGILNGMNFRFLLDRGGK